MNLIFFSPPKTHKRIHHIVHSCVLVVKMTQTHTHTHHVQTQIFKNVMTSTLKQHQLILL